MRQAQNVAHLEAKWTMQTEIKEAEDKSWHLETIA
jgi:hypothetical protein